MVANASGPPAPENVVVGLLIDVSQSMLGSIGGQTEHQGRLRLFRALLRAWRSVPKRPSLMPTRQKPNGITFLLWGLASATFLMFYGVVAAPRSATYLRLGGLARSCLKRLISRNSGILFPIISTA